jgi:homogentisate 1,2-dioxygenase
MNISVFCTSKSSSDAESFDRGSNAELKPHKLEGTMAFIFEMRFPRRVTAYAAGSTNCKGNTAPMGKKAAEAFRSKQASR